MDHFENVSNRKGLLRKIDNFKNCHFEKLIISGKDDFENELLRKLITLKIGLLEKLVTSNVVISKNMSLQKRGHFKNGPVRK